MYEDIVLIMSNQRQEYEAEHAKQLVRVPYKVNMPLFTPLIGLISINALNKLYEQFELAHRSDFPVHYACTTMSSMGLPCGHVVRLYSRASMAIRPQMIYRHWYFYPNQAPEYEAGGRLLLDLLPVRTRGRPMGSTSTRRDLSQ